jgi:hypothetical protein
LRGIANVQRAREVGALKARGSGKWAAVLGVFIVLACASTLALDASGAGAATPPSGFFGVGGWSYPTGTQAVSLSGDGLRLVRGALSWGDVQQNSSPSSRNWSGPDALANEAASDHFNIIFDINGCAAWACGGTTLAAPTGAELTAFESFVSAAVARYAPGSSFWKGKPSVPTITWQVWNEVNGGYFWPNPTPAAYASFFETTAQAIRAVQPSAQVIMSGLTGLPGASGSGGIALVPFLQGLLAQPGFAQATDAIVIHGYAPNPSASIALLDETRRTMLAAGDGAAPIWITEMGWASAGPASSFTVTPAEQADYLEQSWSTMLACAPRWNLQHVLWFSLQDINASVFGTADYWGFNTGLLDVNGAAKPAYADFLQFIGSQPVAGTSTCTLPGGLSSLGGATSSGSSSTSNTGTTTTTSSGARILFMGLRSVTNRRRKNLVRFEDVVGGKVVRRARFQCSLDRRRWQRCNSPFNAATTRQGEHSLTVRALAPGAAASSASASWLVYYEPPTTTISSFAVSPSANNVYIASFSAIDHAGVSSYRCQLDGGRWRACSSPYTTPPLGVGLHVLEITATDRAGNHQRQPTKLRFWVR